MEKREVIYRHSGAVRITHWINALVLLVLLMSGLQIFNAHPALYLGQKSAFDDPIMSMDADEERRHHQGRHRHARPATSTRPVCSASAAMPTANRGARLPLVGDAARPPQSVHGTALAFLLRLAVPVSTGSSISLWSLASGHLRRDLAPSAEDLKHIGTSIAEHARLRFPRGEEAKRYNVLQKLAYLCVASSFCR